MSGIKRSSILLLRLAMAFIAMVIAYILSTMVIGDTSAILTPQEASQAGRALVIVSLVFSLVLSFLILRSPWHGLKLVAAVVIVQFGTETFMAQMETLYFNSAIHMGMPMLASIVAAGALRALIFAPLAVLALGKMKESGQPEVKKAAAVPPDWGKRFAALTLLYVIVYFMFGYFVAWQWAETRMFYSGTTAMKPFLTHFWDLFHTDPIILPFQVLRGALWTALAFLIVQMIRARRWEASLAVASTFAVLLSLPLGLFPNPYIPPAVAQSHFFELVSSMMVFGGIAGWTLYAAESRPGNR